MKILTQKNLSQKFNFSNQKVFFEPKIENFEAKTVLDSKI